MIAIEDEWIWFQIMVGEWFYEIKCKLVGYELYICDWAQIGGRCITRMII